LKRVEKFGELKGEKLFRVEERDPVGPIQRLNRARGDVPQFRKIIVVFVQPPRDARQMLSEGSGRTYSEVR